MSSEEASDNTIAGVEGLAQELRAAAGEFAPGDQDQQSPEPGASLHPQNQVSDSSLGRQHPNLSSRQTHMS